MQGYSGAKPPRVPGLAAQALPSGKSSPKNTTLFIDLSPRSKSGTNSPRVQGTHDRSNWEENGSVSSRPGSSNGGKKENATDQQKGSEVIVAAVNGSTTESATKTTDAQAISSPMRSRQPASSVFGAQTGGSDLPSDEDGTWSPLRESDDHNAQLQNCYDGLRALEMRCGFINKQLAIKAKHIMLDLSTRLNDASTSRQSGDVRRREIDDEVAVLTSDTPTQSDLEETLQTIRDRIDSKKKVLDGHEDRVKQLDKEKSAAAKKPKKKRQELEASLAQKEDEMMMAKAEAEEAIEQGERELEDFPKTHAEMVKIYSDRIRLLQVEKRFSLQNDSSLSREEKLVTEEIALKEQQLSRVRRGRDNVHASINALRATLDDTPRRMAILENKKMLIEEEWQRAIHRLSTVENVVQLQHIQRDVQAEIRPLPARHAWLDELFLREKSRIASLVLAIHECFSAEERRFQFEKTEFEERATISESLKGQMDEERTSANDLKAAFDVKGSKLKTIYRTRRATMTLNKQVLGASIERHVAAKPEPPPTPDYTAVDKADAKKKKKGDEDNGEETEGEKARREFAEKMAKYEEEQKIWADKMEELAGRSKAANSAIENLENLENDTPAPETMPDVLLAAKEGITKQAASRASEFETLWRKSKTRSVAHIKMSTKEDAGVNRTLQEVMITGLQVDVDGEILDKDVLTQRNAALDFEKKIQKKEFQQQIESLETKAVRVQQANEEQLEALEEMNTDSIEYLKQAMADQKQKFEDERKAWALKMQEQKDDYEGKLLLVKGKLKRTEAVSERRLNWISSLQKDLDQEKSKLKAHTDKAAQEIQRRAQMVSDLKQELGQADDLAAKRLNVMDALRAKAIDSRLKLEDAQRKFEEEMEDVKGHLHKAKHEIYRRDEAIRYLLVHPMELLRLYTEATELVSGRMKTLNDALGESNIIEVMIGLCASPDKLVRAKAIRSLGRLTWNGGVERSVVSYFARDLWARWLERLTEKAAAAMQETVVAVFSDNAEIAAKARAANVNHKAALLGRKLLKRVRTKGVHVENQKRIANAAGTLTAIVRLCADDDEDVRQSACDAVAIISLHDTNKKKLLSTHNCVQNLVTCCNAEQPDGVQRTASAAIANLAYGSLENQAQLGNGGAVEALVSVLGSEDIDVLENATAALANLVANSDRNSARLFACGGVRAVLQLLSVDRAAESVETHSNAAEVLANATRLQLSSDIANEVHELGVQPLVLLCASPIAQVQRNAALALGNLAQDDEHRKNIGDLGGIEALFVVSENQDMETRRDSAWALSNLAWTSDNQDRIGRLMSEVARLCRSDQAQVLDKATCLLANALYFHEGNRRRFASLQGGEAMIRLIELVRRGGIERWETRSNAARAIGALAYNDELAVRLGKFGAVHATTSILADFVDGAGPRSADNKIDEANLAGGVAALRHAVFALGNLGVMDVNKQLILQAGAIDHLVRLNVHSDEELRKAVAHALKILGDLNDTAEHEAKREKIKLDALIDTIKSDEVSTTQRGAAAEMLLEESVTDGLGSMQSKIVDCGGIGALIDMVKHCRRERDGTAMVKALWAMRTSVIGNDSLMRELQTQGGLLLLLDIIGHAASLCDDQSVAREAQEAALACALAALMGHPHNCRVMLSLGIDQLIDLAGAEDTPEHNRQLIFDILQLLGPYSYVECSNCGKRQPKGRFCVQCGFETGVELARSP